MRKTKYYTGQQLSVRFYDQLTSLDAGIKGDIAFYARGLSPGDSVLEIGCGSGRVAFGLAEFGLHVLGIDSAEGMLDIARRKQAQMPPQIAARTQFILADATLFAAPMLFKRVLFPFYTINFLPHRKARLQALTHAANQLSSGGEILLHCIPVERLKTARQPASPPPSADLSIPVGAGQVLELYWGERIVDPAKEKTAQRLFIVCEGQMAPSSKSPWKS